MNYIITGKNFTSPLFNLYKSNTQYSIITEKDLITSQIEFMKTDKIYAPDESSVPIIFSKIKTASWREEIENIKNKYTCRCALKKLYPDVYFKNISLNKLDLIQLEKNKKYIIKPQKGFFGVGVKEIDSNTNLKQLKRKLATEITSNCKVFSNDVFSSEDFIIEEFISGEEYAFDIFYNEKGKPVLVNACHHPASKISSYFHLLYYTHNSLFERFQRQIIDIFSQFNEKKTLQNIPIHAEFREQNNHLIPIEWNIPRFGGFGVADLPYYAYGVNSFDCFFESREPNWTQILKEKGNAYYGWVLCYNGINIDKEKHKPNYEKMKRDLGNVLQFYALDYKTNPAFGIAYVKKETKEDLFQLLSIDFKNYFI